VQIIIQIGDVIRRKLVVLGGVLEFKKGTQLENLCRGIKSDFSKRDLQAGLSSHSGAN
jgi:hypothetical protein